MSRGLPGSAGRCGSRLARVGVVLLVLLGAGAEASLAASDLAGLRVDPLARIAPPGVRGAVLVFLGVDCPISKRYSPLLVRLRAKFTDFEFWFVYPNSDESNEAVEKSLREHGFLKDDAGLKAGVLRDPDHALVKLAKASVTPEVAVFAPGRELVYHGRIDDTYVDLGKRRHVVTRNDLDDVLVALRAGRKLEPGTAPAVGCPIVALAGDKP